MIKSMADKVAHYEAIYQKVIVTYLDDSIKVFDGYQWALFSERILKMKTKSIEKVLKIRK
jgi:hypothetical protein